MRVTRIPGDFHDIGDKPCRVYLNEVEVLDWIVADDFRRVVETPTGAKFGSVRVDLANSVEFDGIKTPDIARGQAAAPEVSKPAETRMDTGLQVLSEGGPNSPEFDGIRVASKSPVKKKRGR